jgi:hypothetical protein
MNDSSLRYVSSGLISLNFSKRICKTKNFSKFSSLIQTLFTTHPIIYDDTNLIIKKDEQANTITDEINDESLANPTTSIELACSKSEKIGAGIYFSKENG